MTTLILFLLGVLGIIGVALLTLNPVSSARAELSAENSVASFNGIVIRESSSVPTQTWTQDTRADWEAGTLELLDSTTSPGSLQLARQSFSTPVIIPSEHLASWQGSPDIAVDSAGNAYAVWVDGRDDDANVYFAYRPTGGTWGTSIRVNDDSGAMSQDVPAIAVDGAGNAYAVWEDWRNSNSDIYFAYRPADGMWRTNVRVNDDTGRAEQGAPDIAVDEAGNVYAVWQDKRNDDGDIYFAYRPVGGVWGTSVKINDDTSMESKNHPVILGVAIEPTRRPIPRLGQQYDPAITVDKGGNAYAIWAENRDGRCNIYSSVRPSGSVWGSNVKVNDDTKTAWRSSPDIDVDDNGNLYAVWEDERNGCSDIYFATHPAGSRWGANVQIGNVMTATVWQYAPAIAVDENGDGYAVWQDRRNDMGDIYLSHRSASGTWDSAVKINEETDMVSQVTPAIAVDGNSNAYIVWEDYQDNKSRHIYFTNSAQEYHPQGIYTSPVLDTRMITAAWESFNHLSIVPEGTSLLFETRSLVSYKEAWSSPDWSDWQSVTPVSQTLQVSSPRGRYLQYRVTFSTTHTNITPVLDQVRIVYRWSGAPSAPNLSMPCGVTNQTTPTLRGSALEDSVVHLYVDGTEIATQTVGPGTLSFGAFAFAPRLTAGLHTITATAENENGVGPASASLSLMVNPSLAYDPVNVRAGGRRGGDWLLSVPRDTNGCANPHNGWRVWPRSSQPFQVRVPISYATSAVVTVTVGTQTITLTEEGGTGLFVGIFQPPIQMGEFAFQINADGDTTTVAGGPVLIDPDGVVYERSHTINDTIAGVTVTCYYSDTYRRQWTIWDAWNYQQINPHVTLSDGYYSFYTPRGTYRVVAEKEGYPTYTSPNLVVVSTPVRHNIPLGWYEIYLPLIMRGTS